MGLSLCAYNQISMVFMGDLGCTSCLHKAVSRNAELCDTPGLSGLPVEGQSIINAVGRPYSDNAAQVPLGSPIGHFKWQETCTQ